MENNDKLYDNTSTSNNEEKPNWYVLHTISGYENVAKQNLELTIEKLGLQNRIFKIIIPMEEKVVEKKGKRVIVAEKLMPSYMFIKMIYGDDIWHSITRTRGVTGFVGPKGRPLALTEEEIRNSKLEEPEDLTIYEGDVVKIIDGVLKDSIGKVKSIDLESKKCTVEVQMVNEDYNYEIDMDKLEKHKVTNY